MSLLIAANGYFVAAEFAYVASRRSKFAEGAEDGDKKSIRALAVHKRLSFMLSGAQLGITVTSLVLGFIARPAIAGAIEPVLEAVGVGANASFGVSLVIAFVLATIAQMVFGELAPKNLAIAKPEPVARAVAGSTLRVHEGRRSGHPAVRRIGQPAAAGCSASSRSRNCTGRCRPRSST